MKLMKKFTFVLILTLSLLTLVSCGMESYAKKINKRAEKDDHITYSEVVKKLGEDKIIDLTTGSDAYASGIIIKVKGVTSVEELEQKINDGETLKGIRVIIVLGKAVSAEYTEIDMSSVK